MPATTPTIQQNTRPLQSLTPMQQQQQQQNMLQTSQSFTTQVSVNYLDQDRKRFLVELEFVQCLANPNYLTHLAKQGYFRKDEFKNYLKYLLYWKKPEYIKFIKFPECLYFLDLLQQDELYDGITNNDYVKFISEQQLLHWKYYQTRREQQEQMIMLEHQNFYNIKQNQPPAPATTPPPQSSSSSINNIKAAVASTTATNLIDGLTLSNNSSSGSSPITTTLLPFETNTNKIINKKK